MKKLIILFICILLISITACTNDSNVSSQDQENKPSIEVNNDIDETPSDAKDNNIKEDEPNVDNQNEDKAKEDEIKKKELLDHVQNNTWINDEQQDSYMIYQDGITAVGFGYDKASEEEYEVEEINVDENYIVFRINKYNDLWETTSTNVDYLSKVIVNENKMTYIHKLGEDDIKSNWHIGSIEDFYSN
ncbi:hypothetical protein GC105_10255 [Alkalibaculum sp. M08DMB]|uniref:DUF4652 domain-containing protein n=1 Tax=Alkalibaculum sporogenes TaxID=2655001 RepID=A0A6A7KA32_9FIRM|nr:hypothetical protein [Alkalibaculum sporogenes]MPW26171.1 hypothetical protein [Alkalibaculum sporogenes]